MERLTICDLREEKGAGYFYIERPPARVLEALSAATSMRTNQKAVFVLVVRDLNAAVRSERSNAKIEMGNLHVSGILETSKYMLITSLLAEGNEKIKQEFGKDRSKKRTGKLHRASMFGLGGKLCPLGRARNESKNSLLFWR